ncbi:MAG: ABC transporter permease [Bacteroidota bacterium]
MNTSPNPPKWANRFLTWFCSSDFLEEVQGDIYETYYRNVEVLGKKRANRRFVWDVLRFFNYSTIKGNNGWKRYNPNLAMYGNYFKSAFRNFSRNKAFTFLNVLGLTLGLTSSLLIGLWVYDELTYDTYLPETERVHQVMANMPSGDEMETWIETPQPLAGLVDSLIPEIDQATYMWAWEEESLIEFGDKSLKEKGIKCGSNFFEVLPFPFVQGDPRQALVNPDGIVISESFASRLKGPDWYKQSLLGETFILNQEHEVQVSGVFKDIPPNATHKVDFFVSVDKTNDHWGNYNYKTYIKVLPNADLVEVEQKIFQLYKEKKEMGDPGMIDWDSGVGIFLHPFRKMYLYGKFENGKAVGGRISYVRILGIAGLIILLIACVNYMNLSTAQSLKRAKEIGVRKVIGARKAHLVSQFTIEALLLTFIAVGMALFLTQWLLPGFNSLIGKKLHIGYESLTTWTLLLTFGLITGLLAGSYPAFFLSSFKVLSILKGTNRFSFSNLLLRKGLVVFQFTISLLLIVCTLGVHLQLSYFRSKDLGFNRSQVIYKYLTREEMKQKEALSAELAQSPYIKNYTFTSSQMIRPNRRASDPSWKGKDPQNSQVFTILYTDDQFVNTFDIPIVKGNNFSPEIRTDSVKATFLINEMAAEIMGMEEPIGELIDMGGYYEGPIVGVVKDFHQNSLHLPIEPMVIENKPEYAFLLMVKSQSGAVGRSLKDLETIQKKFSPDIPMEYFFLDQEYEKLYKSEQVVGTLSSFAAALAIIVSCLGLFGLALFTTKTRTREISIRKVLGASLLQITNLLTKDYLQLIVLSLALAIPLSLYFLQQWLNQFAFQTELKPWIFIVSSLMVLFVSFLSVFQQALQTALTNPAEHLHGE